MRADAPRTIAGAMQVGADVTVVERMRAWIGQWKGGLLRAFCVCRAGESTLGSMRRGMPLGIIFYQDELAVAPEGADAFFVLHGSVFLYWDYRLFAWRRAFFVGENSVGKRKNSGNLSLEIGRI